LRRSARSVSLLAAVGELRGCDAGMIKQHLETSVTSLGAATIRRLEYLLYTTHSNLLLAILLSCDVSVVVAHRMVGTCLPAGKRKICNSLLRLLIPLYDNNYINANSSASIVTASTGVSGVHALILSQLSRYPPSHPPSIPYWQTSPPSQLDTAPQLHRHQTPQPSVQASNLSFLETQTTPLCHK